MPRNPDRAIPPEGSIDWHIEKVFELAELELSKGQITPAEMLHSLYVSFLFRTRDYLGVRKQEVFDVNDEIKSLFLSAWMEDAEQETKH